MLSTKLFLAILFIISSSSFVLCGKTRRGVGKVLSASQEQAGREARSEIHSNENLSNWAAQSAVDSAAGRDYQNQLLTTADYVSQFTAPVTKQQANDAFGDVGNSHQQSQISASLASNAYAIHAAAMEAAQNNFASSYANIHGSSYNTNPKNREGRLTPERDSKGQHVATNAAALSAVSNVKNLDHGVNYSPMSLKARY